MRYCAARIKQNADERIYRIYVTDALKAAYGLNKRYATIFMPNETRTPEEIITSISDKLKAAGGEDDG